MKLIEKFPDLISDAKSKKLAPFFKDVHVFDLKNLSDESLPNGIVVLANELDMSKVIDSFASPQVQHVVQTQRDDFYRDVIISCLLIKKPEGFLKNPIPFFVSNFEGDPDYKAKYRSASFVLKTTDEKTGLMSELRKFLTKRKSTKALMHPVLLIADELLANAFFNAPVDSLGTPTHRNVQRDASFKLSKPVRFFIAHDRKRLVVGCQDDFGSISRTQLLQALSRAYSGKKSRVDAEARSAGLGCKMMIDRSLAFYVVTKKKRQSLVCCALDLGRGQLRAELVPKNVHLCFW